MTSPKPQYPAGSQILNWQPQPSYEVAAGGLLLQSTPTSSLPPNISHTHAPPYHPQNAPPRPPEQGARLQHQAQPPPPSRSSFDAGPSAFFPHHRDQHLGNWDTTTTTSSTRTEAVPLPPSTSSQFHPHEVAVSLPRAGNANGVNVGVGASPSFTPTSHVPMPYPSGPRSVLPPRAQPLSQTQARVPVATPYRSDNVYNKYGPMDGSR